MERQTKRISLTSRAIRRNSCSSYPATKNPDASSTAAPSFLCSERPSVFSLFPSQRHHSL
jgi:hypothetical protein